MKAAVVGGTGAIGQEIVNQLLKNTHFKELVFIGRRAPVIPEGDKLVPFINVVVNFDGPEFKSEVDKHLEGTNVVFCSLGTTRGAAGSADAFRKVDYEYVAASAAAAKRAGVPHFSVVSSQGANPNMYANDTLPFHSLLYCQTKGRAEEAVKAQGFEHTTIVRPGLLNRGSFARPLERFFQGLGIVKSIPVADVAASMISDALKYEHGVAEGGSESKPAAAAAAAAAAAEEKVRLISMDELLREAAARA